MHIKLLIFFHSYRAWDANKSSDYSICEYKGFWNYKLPQLPNNKLILFHLFLFYVEEGKRQVKARKKILQGTFS